MREQRAERSRGEERIAMSYQRGRRVLRLEQEILQLQVSVHDALGEGESEGGTEKQGGREREGGRERVRERDREVVSDERNDRNKDKGTVIANRDEDSSGNIQLSSALFCFRYDINSQCSEYCSVTCNALHVHVRLLHLTHSINKHG